MNIYIYINISIFPFGMGPDVLLLFCYSLYKLSCHQRRKAVPEPNPSCPCRPLSSIVVQCLKTPSYCGSQTFC